MLLFVYTLLDDEQRDKFDLLFNRYYSSLFLIARSILKNDMDAEDVLQLAFMRVANNLQKIDEVESSKTKGFLVTIVRNLSLNKYNQNKKIRVFEAEQPDDAQNYIPDITSSVLETQYQETKEIIIKLLKKLPENYQTVLIYRYFKEWTYKEIAELLGTTDKNVSQILLRARKQLTKLYNEEMQ